MIESNLQPSLGMVIRQTSPPNLEYPFSQLSNELTPVNQFYVRCHFPIPEIEESDHVLSVTGSVGRELRLSMKQLQAMPKVTRTATLECAGNGRVFLEPQVKGAQWQLGAVGNAAWSGVLLSTVLQEAGINSDAVEVVLQGRDKGKPNEPPMPPDDIHYARSVPISKALDDVLLAYEMNGEPLLPSHGFPVRAIVPGWYGMASVKWLSKIILVDQKFEGYFQTIDYAYWDEQAGSPVRMPLTEMKLKSQISRPAPFETVRNNTEYLIRGAAWSGKTPVEAVEISTDAGKTFSPAKWCSVAHPVAWRLWEFMWKTPSSSGRYTLISRARDVLGNVQPQSHELKYGTYVIQHTIPIEVIIK